MPLDRGREMQQVLAAGTLVCLERDPNTENVGAPVRCWASGIWPVPQDSVNLLAFPRSMKYLGDSSMNAEKLWSRKNLS